MKFAKQVLCITCASVLIASSANSQNSQCPGGVKELESGKNCPCVSLKTRCSVTDTNPEYSGVFGKHCSNLNVRKDSNGEYPLVNVKYSWEMCNHNNFNIRFKKRAKFYSWTLRTGKDNSIDNPAFPLGGTTLKSGDCKAEEVAKSLNTTHRHNMAAQLEGFVLADDGVTKKDPKTDFCFAYEYGAVNVKRGLCPMSTDVSCTAVDENVSCQEYIDTLEADGRCVDFSALIRYEACNNADWTMKIFSDVSNVKLRMPINGSKKTTAVGNVEGPLAPKECKSFSKEIWTHSCSSDSLSYSINVQGSNKKGKYWYECNSYSFGGLSFATHPPTTSPTISNEPSTLQSSEPSVSHRPSVSQPSSAPPIALPTDSGKGGKGGKGSSTTPTRSPAPGKGNGGGKGSTLPSSGKGNGGGKGTSPPHSGTGKGGKGKGGKGKGNSSLASGSYMYIG